MITIKLLSYAPGDGVQQTDFVFDEDDSMNDFSFVDKILSAAIVPYELLYCNFLTCPDSDVIREIVLAFPSFMADRLETIASYLYDGLCLAFVVRSDKLLI